LRSNNDIIRPYPESTTGFFAGFSAGLFFQYNFPKIVSIRTGIAYERKGGKGISEYYYYHSQAGEEIKIRDNYDYLTFPLLVRATFGKKFQFFVNVGTYFSYLIKCTHVNLLVNVNTIDYTSYHKRFDTGISTGLGFSVPI